MRVVEIEIQDQQKRYVVIDDTGSLIEPIARYLKYLDRIKDVALVCFRTQDVLGISFSAAN